MMVVVEGQVEEGDCLVDLVDHRAVVEYVRVELGSLQRIQEEGLKIEGHLGSFAEVGNNQEEGRTAEQGIVEVESVEVGIVHQEVQRWAVGKLLGVAHKVLV